MEKMENEKKIGPIVISAMILLALFAALTSSASAYCNSGSNDVVVTNPGGTYGGPYPYTYTTQSETTVTYTTINAASLANYDTFVMWRVCGGHLNIWTAQQKQDIVDWVNAGGKLIIWDTECTDNPDYSWLPYSFVTSNPGAQGARVCPLTVVEENTLSSSVTTSPYYIDTNSICTNTDAVGDANILTSYSTQLCVDMTAKNVLGTTGPVHVYAHYGTGLILYCGLDADHITRSSTGGVNLRQILLNELAQPWGDEACGLPCGAPIPPGDLTVDKTGDKTTMNVGETVTFTITVENTGASAITSITLEDILPPQLSTTDPTTWTIGTLNPGATATRTLTATAVAVGIAHDVAKAEGIDANGNKVGSDDSFKVTITDVALDICPDDYRWNTLVSPTGYEWDPFPALFRSWNDVRFVNNDQGEVYSVSATITCVPLNVVVVDGDVALGDIPAGGSAWSLDYFVLETDMTNPENPNKGICWEVTYYDANGGMHVIPNVAKYCGEVCKNICP